MRRVTLSIAVALGVLGVAGVVGACGDGEGQPGQVISGEERGTGHGHGESEKAAFSKEEADTALEYTLVDYRFEGPMTAKGPKLFFIAQNKGTEDHELEILDDRGKALGEIEAFAPEDGPKTLAIELRPGTYTLQCILETPQGGVHRELGMVTELVVE